MTGEKQKPGISAQLLIARYGRRAIHRYQQRHNLMRTHRDLKACLRYLTNIGSAGQWTFHQVHRLNILDRMFQIQLHHLGSTCHFV